MRAATGGRKKSRQCLGGEILSLTLKVQTYENGFSVVVAPGIATAV
jgi:hypothetical protein